MEFGVGLFTREKALKLCSKAIKKHYTVLISIYSRSRQAGITAKHSIYLKLVLTASCSFNNFEEEVPIFSIPL